MKIRVEMVVFNGTSWLTSSQILEMIRCANQNLNDPLSEWKSEGRLFSIVRDGVEYFPAYAFDTQATYQPLKVIAELITAFQAKKDGWDIAVWCQFPNSYLGGKRPKDVLAIDPSSVVKAACHEANGVLHG